MDNYVGSLELNLNNNYTGRFLTKAPQSTSCRSHSFFVTWKPVCLGRKSTLGSFLPRPPKLKIAKSPLSGNDIHKKAGQVRACSGAVWSTAEPELVHCHDGNLTPFIKSSKLKLMSQIASRVPWSTAPSSPLHGERSTWATPPTWSLEEKPR